MPTPSDAAPHLNATELPVEPPTHPSCPPEYDDSFCTVNSDILDNSSSTQNDCVDDNGASLDVAPPSAQRLYGNGLATSQVNAAIVATDNGLVKRKKDEDISLYPRRQCPFPLRLP